MSGISSSQLRASCSMCSPSRPFHSALKRQLKAEKKAKDKELKQAQTAAQQKTTVSTRVVVYSRVFSNTPTQLV